MSAEALDVLSALDMTPTEAPEAPVVEAVVEAPVVETPPEAAAVVAPVVEPVAEQKQGMVPHAALVEARELAKQYKSQIAELQAQPKLTKEDQELLADLKAQRAAAAAQPPVVPEFTQDPKGYVDEKLSGISATLKKLEETATSASTKANATQEQVRHGEQLSQLMTTVSAHETAFIAKTPDYFDALEHMRTQRIEQLGILHPEATEAQIKAQVGTEELIAAATAIKAGKDPAAEAMRLAKTFGYRKAEAKVDPPAKVEAAPDRDAARTLTPGSAPDAEPDSGGGESSVPEFQAALAERFGRRR